MNKKIKTAVYTICKNEIHNIERWIYYGSFYDYRVLLDTGSTDGTWEALQTYNTVDKNLIIEQKIFDPWHFANARNYNLSMIPDDVDWCLSPDLDEFFTKNTLDELTAAYTAHPDMTNLSCDRIDVYSYNPRIGPPDMLPSNKIHKRHDYIWDQPIHEHLKWKHDGYEKELYSEKIYLIHDQDFKKSTRSNLYIKMLTEEYENNPTNTWCLWFLVNHYYTSLNMPLFVKTACDYVTYHPNQNDKNYQNVLNELKNIYQHKPKEATKEILLQIENILTKINIL